MTPGAVQAVARPARPAPARAWTPLAAVAVVVVGAAYPLTAARFGPVALPAAVLGVAALAVAAQRPPLGVALAFVLTSLTPGLVGPKAWLPGAAWIGALFVLVVASREALSGRRAIALPPLSVAALVFLGTVLFAFALSPDRASGLPIFRTTVTGVVLFFVAASVLSTEGDVLVALRGAAAAGVLVGGYATLQRVLGVSTGVGFITSTGALVDRVNGGFGEPNLLGGFLVMLVPLAAVAAVVDRRWRLVHIAALALSLGGIYASFSRGALIAVLVVPFIVIRGRWLLVLVPAAVLLLGAAVPSVMAERFAVANAEGGELAGRRDIWNTALAVWKEDPIVGVGLGGFPKAYASARVVGKQFLPDTRFVPPPHAHNLGLQLLAEQGVVGAAAFGLLFGRAAWAAVMTRRSMRDRRSLLAAGVLAALAAMAVHNIFDVTLVENAGIQFWGILGILSALVALDRERVDVA